MSLVDLDVAVRVGAAMAGSGPDLSPGDAHRVVEALRRDADRATPLVREFTGLEAGVGTAPVLVVDRAGWIRANAAGFSRVLDPLEQRWLADGRPEPGRWGRAATGAEMGVLLGYLSSKILGQFEPFSPPHGRLLLVAPNIVATERQLGVDPDDFRLWVCVHEETHRVQFTAVPWLADHLDGLMTQLVGTMEPAALGDAIGRAVEAIRSGAAGGILEVLRTPEQTALMDQVTGVMSLLEGHAEMVMDDVGPTVIPSVAQIRKAFSQRRQGAHAIDRWIRRLLGLDVKMAQYRDGASFVRAVIDRVGMEQFNAVWAAPEHLPSKAELAAPDAWVTRVLG